jgi:spore coat protein U-like protein
MRFPTGRPRWLLSIALACVCLPAAGAGCTVSSPGLAFGPYQPLTLPGRIASAERAAVGTVTVSCSGTGGGSYTIALGPSLAGNSSNPRYLSNPMGGPDLAFNLFLDPAYSVVWGDGTTGGVLSGTVPTALPGTAPPHTVYGRLPAGQARVRAGSFSGSMTMTIRYDP